jgi:hypothetical protein
MGGALLLQKLAAAQTAKLEEASQARLSAEAAEVLPLLPSSTRVLLRPPD